jgi:hypothetical protein
MNEKVHTNVNLAFWVAIVFPLSPVIGTNTLTFFFFVWSLLVVIVGSKFPDIDHTKAKIHKLPIFGKFIYYFILNPLRRALPKKEFLEHRRFVHSLPGLIVISVLMLIYLLIATLVFWVVFYWIISPLSINIFSLDLQSLWESYEMVPINESYFYKFLILNIIAFGYGFFFHLWFDYSTVMGIRWVRFWKKPLMDGYIRTSSRNERRAIQLFSIIPVIIISLEILFMRQIRLLFWIFILVDITTLVMIGIFLRSTRFFQKFFLAKTCPECSKKGAIGLQILRIRGGEECYGCSNYFKTGCEYSLEDKIEPSDLFTDPELSTSKAERSIDLIFFFLVILGFFYHEIFLFFGISLFSVQIFFIILKKRIFEFWKQKY